MKYDFTVIDFRPSTDPGWRAVFVDDTGSPDSEPLAGWLIEAEYGHERWDDPPEFTGTRRVTAAIVDGTGVEPVWCDNFYCLLHPGQDEPTLEQISPWWEQKQKSDLERRQRAKAQ